MKQKKQEIKLKIKTTPKKKRKLKNFAIYFFSSSKLVVKSILSI
jgi:hypothetical protein